MPNTTRTCVRASIVYLCLGALIGALLLLNRWTLWWPVVAALSGSHVVLLTVGWLTQLIMGVAWWLFPPLPIGLGAETSRWYRHGQTQRGSEPLFWVTVVCLNVGVLTQAISGPLYAWTQVGLFDLLARSSVLFLLAAAVAFVANMWGRVRELARAK